MHLELESWAAAIAILLALWGTGRVLLRVLVAGVPDVLSQLLFSIGLGLAAWSGLLAALARARWLNLAVNGGITLPAAMWGLIEIGGVVVDHLAKSRQR